MPVAGKDYPITWSQYLDWFHSEEACRTYLAGLRWPTGFICPKCRVFGNITQSSRGRWVCPTCKHQSTVTAGTIFDKTRTDIRVWFAAIWYITNQKNGVSALGLQRVLGLGSYETAWTMLHRLRRAMVRPSREFLKGEVEVDETYLALTERGNHKSGKSCKSNTTKALVVIAVEILQPKGFGRIRVQRIEKADSANLMPFIR
ncbi:IS1595 family transposase, partial [Colwellia sp. 75C3]|uniref:IS1595 family transposase n=1 Tax=Colwellia sp. 75C3 TaxID=888425 RepID=UPI000CBA5FB2